MTEVPLIFPSHVATPHRFIVNDANRSVRRCLEIDDELPLFSSSDATTDDIHRGSASVSKLTFASGKKAMLTTSVLVENPRVLTVALTCQNDLESPVIVELDLRSEMKTYTTTIHVQAFVESTTGGASSVSECIRIVLVDGNAAVMTIRLAPYTLLPFDDGVEMIKIQYLLEDEPAVQAVVSGAQLHKTMVAFFGPYQMVVALSPCLMSVDLLGHTCHVWLESKCLEAMASRRSAISSLFSKASDLLLGKFDGGLVDMPPTAAMCVSSTPNPLLDPTYVFTLHSDGTIRRWTVNEESPLPIETCRFVSNTLPNPQDWSDAYNSVYIRARLYEHVYALAVHIQTGNGARTTLGHESTASSPDSSIVVFLFEQGIESPSSTHPLDVPRDATSLVDMDFVPDLAKCSIAAVFRGATSHTEGLTTAGSRIATTLHVCYPPSVVSAIERQPVVSPAEFLLDGVAQEERARIEALAFSSDLNFGTGSTLEEDMHELDTRFMKFLFRPPYPRGNGAITAPSEIHIRKALQKLVYGRSGHQSEHRDQSGDSSIPLEVVRAMYDWRTKENRKMAVLSPARGGGQQGKAVAKSTSETPAAAVYHSYVDVAKQNDNDADMSEGEDEEDGNYTSMNEAALANQSERERRAQLDVHERRWRRFLLQVWDEEQALRAPLSLGLLGDVFFAAGTAILVRSGFTSAITHQDCNSGNKIPFDEAALKLNDAIRNDSKQYKNLFALEQRIWHLLSKAQFDEIVPSDFEEGFSIIVDSVFDGGAVFSDFDQKGLRRELDRVSIEDYSRVLQDTPREDSLPGLNLMIGAAIDDRAGAMPLGNPIANNQIRQSVCALSTRCLDSSRRLLLARYLLLSYVGRISRVSSIAFYSYVRSLAVLWTASQQIPIPLTAFQTTSREKLRLGQAVEEYLPPKRLSFGDRACSVLCYRKIEKMTTGMDSLLVHVSQTVNVDLIFDSLLSCVVYLCQRIFVTSMRSTIPTSSDVSSGKLSRLLPELGALPPSRSDSVASDYPRLALRLLSPLLALSSPDEPPNVTTARKEALAECLLIESQHQPNDSAKSMMRVKACEFLASQGIGSLDPTFVRAALNKLWSVSSRMSPIDSTSDAEVSSLIQKLQSVLYGDEPVIRSEIRRLMKLDTVKTIFAPLLGNDHRIASDVHDAVTLLGPIMVHISTLLHRVDILEHHVGRHDGAADLVLDFINSAISELNKLLPPEFCRTMPENNSLYMRLFHNAVAAEEWSVAYDAAVNNPAVDRRVSIFRTLVSSMVSAGALEDLLSMCSTLASSSGDDGATSDVVDLYGIATEALTEDCARDLYLLRANAADASTAAADDAGALYSLHVARGKWREAAQSMDLRFVNAITCLVNPPNGNDVAVAAAREALIVEDLVLSSVGAANSITLVDDVTSRFIVSGECGSTQCNLITSAEVDMELYVENEMKRRRQPVSDSRSSVLSSSLDRISRYMDNMALDERVLWSLSLRTLFDDDTADRSAAKSVFLTDGTPKVDRTTMDVLFQRGYFLQGLQLAMAAMGKAATADRNQNVFYGYLSYAICVYLVPLSLHGAVPGGVATRPTLSQIHRELDDISGMSGESPFVVDRRSKNIAELPKSALEAASMALLRRLAVTHTCAELPLALELAKCILEYDEQVSQLPTWLEQLLMGAECARRMDSNGLFASRPKPGVRVYMGDPSALVSLYTRQGMFLEACRVVTAILVGFDGTEARKEKASHRLPEKGDIDFVPYKKLDNLWNLIETAFQRGEFDGSAAKNLRKAQGEMKRALKDHFALIEITEMGLQSARAIGRNPTAVERGAGVYRYD